jgi:hypothetical protein
MGKHLNSDTYQIILGFAHKLTEADFFTLRVC